MGIRTMPLDQSPAEGTIVQQLLRTRTTKQQDTNCMRRKSHHPILRFLLADPHRETADTSRTLLYAAADFVFSLR